MLGLGFLAMLLLFVWITFAFFNKTFERTVPVRMTASTAGLSLPLNADVKLRGMIIGEVRDVATDGDGVVMDLAIKPEFIDRVPAEVTGQIVPKTLFGEKYVALIAPEETTGRTLAAGDVIAKAEVPVEVETVLNDLYPLLTAIDPQQLAYTLTAVSDALDGRGTELGETVTIASDYLAELSPEVPQLVDSLTELGTVADGYADVMPEVGQLLENAVVTGDTVVAKRAQLEAFFDEGTTLARTLSEFTAEAGDELVTVSRQSRPVLSIVDDYSVTFPCFLDAMATIEPRLNSVMRDRQLHLNLELLPIAGQPTAYRRDENFKVNEEVLDHPAARPTCLNLEAAVAGTDVYSQDNPFTTPAEVYKLIGIKESHNKFGRDDEYQRVAPGRAALNDLVRPSANGVDTPAQRQLLKTMLARSTGTKEADVPDLGALLIGPLLRGSEVKVHGS